MISEDDSNYVVIDDLPSENNSKLEESYRICQDFDLICGYTLSEQLYRLSQKC